MLSKKHKTAGRVIGVILLSLQMQGCRKTEDIKLSKQTVQLVEQISSVHVSAVYELTALPGEKTKLQDYWKALDYAMGNRNPSSPSKTLTREEAIADTHALFAMLKGLYGCYDYFNQEQQFQKAEEAVLHDLALIRSLDYTAFRSCIRTHLRFLEDQHFLIDQTPLKRALLTHTMKETFEKRKDGFYFQNKKVTTVDKESELDVLLKEDIRHKGHYSYFQKAGEQKTEITIQFEDGEALRQKVVPIASYTTEDAMCEQVIHGVPYIHTARMFYMKSEQEKADAFLETAEEFKSSTAAILDLRGNTGGDLLLAESWYRAFSGSQEGGHINTILKMPLQEARLKEKLQSVEVNQSLSALTAGENWKQLDGLHYVVERNTKGLKKNDTVLFVLQDNKTASAAEHLIDRLHSLDNVVFIGTPTAGMLRGSSFMTVYLEHSSLAVSFGNMLSQFPDSYAKEYYGIEPDIWTSDAAGVVEQLLTQ